MRGPERTYKDLFCLWGEGVLGAALILVTVLPCLNNIPQNGLFGPVGANDVPGELPDLREYVIAGVGDIHREETVQGDRPSQSV